MKKMRDPDNLRERSFSSQSEAADRLYLKITDIGTRKKLEKAGVLLIARLFGSSGRGFHNIRPYLTPHNSMRQ